MLVLVPASSWSQRTARNFGWAARAQFDFGWVAHIFWWAAAADNLMLVGIGTPATRAGT